MTENERNIYTLHRYFIWANRFRNNYRQCLTEQGEPPADKGDTTAQFSWLMHPFRCSSYWFASLYVVVEGWKELNLSDSAIDDLLDADHLSLLRRYRNITFHYQAEYFESRLREFYEDGIATVLWVDELHKHFSRWFLDWYRSRGRNYSVIEEDDGTIEINISIPDDGCSENS